MHTRRSALGTLGPASGQRGSSLKLIRVRVEEEFGQQLATAAHSHFLRRAVQVILNRVGRDPHPRGDLLRRKAAGDERDDLAFAPRESVFEKAWRDAGHTEPPTYNGDSYFHMIDNPKTPADEAHGFAPHFELHIWTELPNPAGPYMEWNTRATCRYHRADH